jgi:hypothetical protein
MFDDNDNDDDFLEFNNHSNGEDERIQKIKKAQRLMFIHDLERFPTQPMPISYLEFVDVFGEPTREDKDIMTQAFIKDYLRISNTDSQKECGTLCAKWGLDWLDIFLQHNVEHEEYELCSIFKTVIEGGTDILKQWIKEGIHDE